MPPPLKHVILSAIGTDGDMHPFLGLGKTLRVRGHRVTLTTHEHFAPLAAEGDLEFCPLVSRAETEEFLANPNFWHPVKGPVIIARWGTRLLRRQYQVLRDLAAGPDAVLVANPGVLAARLVQDKLGVPVVSLVLQPWMIPSTHSPPVMMGGLTLPRWAPRWVARAYCRLIDGIGGLLVGGELNRLRASINLRPVRRVFSWWFSPNLILGLFPEWYGTIQPDWPSQVRLAGFPVSDGCPLADLPPDVSVVLTTGKPVVAFTFGTGMKHASELFREAIEACGLVGAQGIFLTKYRSQLPTDLPPWATHCEFAPFQKLFPQCAAVVHHGGIGTTAKALAAGVPQLILPFAFDQLDNAQRVKRLGVGEWLGPKRRRAASIGRSLAAVIVSPGSESARAIALRFQGCDGLTTAADAVEEFWRKGPRPVPV